MRNSTFQNTKKLILIISAAAIEPKKYQCFIQCGTGSTPPMAVPHEAVLLQMARFARVKILNLSHGQFCNLQLTQNVNVQFCSLRSDVFIDLDHRTFVTEQPGSHVMGHLDDYLGHVWSLRLSQSNSQRPLCGALLQKILHAPKTLKKLSTEVSLLAKVNRETVGTVKNVPFGLVELEITSSNNGLLDWISINPAPQLNL